MRRVSFVFFAVTALGCGHEVVSFDPRVSRGTVVAEARVSVGPPCTSRVKFRHA